MMRVVKFVLHSVTAGLAAAFVVLVLKPDLLPGHSPAAPVSQGTPAGPLAPGAASYSRAVAAAAPAVVNILTANVLAREPSPLLNDPFFKRYFGDTSPAPSTRIARSRGSGVILSRDGYIVTNHHLIRGADEIHVMLRDGREASARIVGTDPDTDLAVLKVDLEGLPMVSINRSRRPQVGDVVLAIGNPFGVGQTVTMGIVSATGRSRIGLNTFEDFIQTDAAINPGNSGGALVNPQGELIGINTAIYSGTGGSQGIGFAIPAVLARQVMRDIVEHGYVVRGWLGIEVRELAETIPDTMDASNVPGVVIVNVLPGTPAAGADLRPGDALTHIDGVAVHNSQEALNAIATVSPGTEVALAIVREGQPRTIRVTVAERPRATS